MTQIGKYKNSAQEQFRFSVTNVISISNKGKLFDDLNARTNIQLIEVTHPRFPKGCQIAFSDRSIGPFSFLIAKEIDSISEKTVRLKASQNDSGQLDHALLFQYHGRTID